MSSPANRQGVWQAAFRIPYRREDSRLVDYFNDDPLFFLVEVSALQASEEVVAFSVQGGPSADTEVLTARLTAGEADFDSGLRSPLQQLWQIAVGSDAVHDPRMLSTAPGPPYSASVLLYEPFMNVSVELFHRQIRGASTSAMWIETVISSLDQARLSPFDPVSSSEVDALTQWWETSVPLQEGSVVDVRLSASTDGLRGVVGCPAWRVEAVLEPAHQAPLDRLMTTLDLETVESLSGTRKGRLDFDFEVVPKQPHVVLQPEDPIRSLFEVR